MNTFELFREGIASVPTPAAWYLADLFEYRGRQELIARQSPQVLRRLCESAVIESAVSSNRIEGVTVDLDRIGTVVFGHDLLKDRDEEEVRGYRSALALVHEKGAGLRVDEETIKGLHALARGEVWDGGAYKDRDGDIIERSADGRERLRFRMVPATETAQAMARLVAHYEEALRERRLPPILAMVFFNLDFLCVHPFRDGNGRVSRLLLLLGAYGAGFEVGRYISLERLIEDEKEGYYRALELSSAGWHEGKHDPWPYATYILYILKRAYTDMEARANLYREAKGGRSAAVRSAIKSFGREFSIDEVKYACPAASVELIRKLLKAMSAEGRVRCVKRGRDARWIFSDSEPELSKDS